MVPHRAVYDMSLGDARSGASVTDVEGRMVFEITGSACEGYTQNMRFVTKMGSAEGQPSVTDLRSKTFEDGAATTFRFTSTQLHDQKPSETAEGDVVCLVLDHVGVDGGGQPRPLSCCAPPRRSEYSRGHWAHGPRATRGRERWHG